MRIFFLKDGKWQDYRKELLEQAQAYNFVAWTKSEMIIIAPTEIDGRDFYHKNATNFAARDWIIGEKDGDPDAFGAIRVNFGEEESDDRICSWNSTGYGKTTPEDLRPLIREALGLQDVVYV